MKELTAPQTVYNSRLIKPVFMEFDCVATCEEGRCAQAERPYTREQILGIIAGAFEWPWCCGKPMLFYLAQKPMNVGRA